MSSVQISSAAAMMPKSATRFIDSERRLPVAVRSEMPVA
jgi:hypothetical protein